MGCRENANGQLGDGTSNDQVNPVQVLHDASSMAPFPQISIKATSAGTSHTVYLKGDGTVWAVGYNSNGQLGDGTTTNRSQPGTGGGWIGQPAERGGGDLRGL